MQTRGDVGVVWQSMGEFLGTMSTLGVTLTTNNIIPWETYISLQAYIDYDLHCQKKVSTSTEASTRCLLPIVADPQECQSHLKH